MKNKNSPDGRVVVVVGVSVVVVGSSIVKVSVFFIVELFCRGILVLKGEKGVPDLFLLHYYSSQSMQPSVK
jgi:hypothetical protein